MKPTNIWAVGRNFAAHATEMQAPIPKTPLFFLKSGGCATSGEDIFWPSFATEIHHEIELLLQVDEDLEFCAFGLALDLTERSLQSEAKKTGSPWTLSKSFRGSCPRTEMKKISGPFDDFWSEIQGQEIELKLNGQIKQRSPLSLMIFRPQELLRFAVKHFPVLPGDLFLTGTPEGVGPIFQGQILEGRLGDLIQHRWQVR